MNSNDTPEIPEHIRTLDEINSALDAAGCPTGNEHGVYGAAQRIAGLHKTRDYAWRQLDEIRETLATERAAQEQAEWRLAQIMEVVAAGHSNSGWLSIVGILASTHADAWYCQRPEGDCIWCKIEQELAALKLKLEVAKTAIQKAMPHVQFLIARNPQHAEPRESFAVMCEALSQLNESKPRTPPVVDNVPEMPQETPHLQRGEIVKEPPPDDTGKVLLTKERDSFYLALRHIQFLVAHTWADDTRITVKRCVESALDGTVTPIPDDTGKVLLTKEQWEQAQRDKARLDWLDGKKSKHHAHWGGGGGVGEPASWNDPYASWTVSSSVVRDGTYHFPESLEQMTVRTAIDAARADTKGTSA